jgi:hypothetical protein
MSTPALTERLPRLIADAAARLAKATTAAEVLDAGKYAKAAYDAAKLAKRLSAVKDAHDEIIAACHKAMADALVIESQTKCRLADEYDAAQERGEIAKHGEIGRGRSSQREHLSTSEDIGITRKQVHEARAVRDAEKKKPGLVRKTIEAKLKAGEEPTRADIKRAVNATKPRGGPKPERRKHADTAERAAALDVLDHGKTYDQAATAHDLSSVQIVKTAVAREEGRREKIVEIDPKILSMSAQQKLDAAIKQARRKLELQFHQLIRDEVRKRLEDTILPSYNKTYAEYQTIIKARKGVMDRSTYRKILTCLHTERLAQLLDIPYAKLDASLAKRYDEAFNLFTALEKRLLDEKESPTDFMKMPTNLAEWDALRAKTMRERAAKRAAKSSSGAVRPR